MLQTPSPQPQSKPARPKRVITEARKLQNREAQRAYRQRQKERTQKGRSGLQEKGKGGSTRYQQLQPYPSTQNVQRDVPSVEALDWDAQDYRQAYSGLTAVSSIAGTDLSVSTPSSGTLQETQSIGGASSAGGLSGGGGFLDLLFPTPTTTSSSSFVVDDFLIGSSHQAFLPTPAEEVDTEGLEDSLSSTSSSTSNYTYPTPRRATYQQNQQQQYEHQRQAFRPTASSQTTLLSNPYKNALQTPKTNLITACLSNASALGISIEEFFSYNCMSLCSPFYRQTTSASVDPTTLLSSVTSCYPALPAHLKPTLPQILIPHHPLFDLVPIPILRSRAIILSVTLPHLVDMFELKGDIVEGGLLCLGSGAGRDGAKVIGNGSGSVTGQPWEVGSWEIAPWFLKKWKLLLDKESGDLWG
ncbi:hypothetical protein ASPCAL14142 [Aspergillus calidoustus]|uniref:BZIP domain-containing protein n=1 Tax=Aspergillus calidoustus TaxID=454130 RepID=A0A0U5GGD2_ASPCI|nr:hypothetical protein ASPCAL14142 [Aspergillus calidoustus]